MPKFSVVVPAYRGHNTIEELFEELRVFFASANESFEIIFVFDDGPAITWDVIQRLVHAQPGVVKGLKLSRNFGQHNATICGFEFSQGEWIITMDEDLQHSPADIQRLITAQVESHRDVVYGYARQKKHNTFRNVTSSFLNSALQVAIPHLHRHYSSFRLINAAVAKQTCAMRNSYTFLDGYLTWITTNVGSVEVSHAQSKAGQSAYSTRKLIGHALNIIITFSFLPIRVVTLLSSIVFVLSSGFAIYTLIRKLVYNDFVSGFATFAIMGGLGLAFILFSLGIIGEYILRINLKTTQRPNYIIKETIE